MALSQNRAPGAVAPDVTAFVGGLRMAWRAGKVRPTPPATEARTLVAHATRSVCRSLVCLAGLARR